MTYILRLLFVVFYIGLLPIIGFSQDFVFDTKNLLIETQWRYAYTMHVSSNTIVHQADEAYLHYVLFKYDSTYQQYLNGVTLAGKWTLDEKVLSYPFRKVNSFHINKVNAQALEVTFTLPNANGEYLYHFNRADNDAIPFARGKNELPQVIVKRKPKAQKDNFIAKAIKKRKKRRKRKDISEEPFIQIELVGGGYYGGIDPVLRDHIIIKNNGRLIKEFKSKQSGLRITKKNIPREELESFVKWAEEQNFFKFDRQYDCGSSICEKRKFDKPRPMPLRISIAYGTTRKIVTVSIWGKDKTGIKYIDYPPQLDNIIDAIQRMANRV